MQGFKSFPDALRIDFHEGITGIVGPNGSGKSNIADAIRWVLGEQSTRTLRGAKMEDVIFAGTEQRRRMGMAEVTLTLDNAQHQLKTEFAEVAVTRRYYRSGESEYYINKKAVRLRDIYELFMDTGIGRDGYSVIGQGRIDEILSVRAQDRRELFDEAAGITKFRYRRDEAERRLAEAEDNLTRIHDVMQEMEQRLPGLSEQAEKERRYNALRSEQRGLEVAVWLDSLRTADAELERAEQDRTAAEEGLAQAAEELSALEREAGTLAARMRALEEAQEKARGELQECVSGIAEADGQLALVRAALERNRAEAQSRESDRAADAAREQALERELDEAREEGLRRSAAAREAETAAEAAEARVREAKETAARLEREREALRAQAEILRTRESDARAAEARAQAQASELRARLDELHAESRTRDAAREAARVRLDEAGTREQQARDALTEKENVRAGLERLRKSAETRAAEIAERYTKQRIRMGDTENRLRLLSELAREYEGYAKAVRAVMNRREALGGIHGPVSSLITVEDSCVTAVETALGASAGNIVVDTEEDARRAIGMLKSRDEGRATFLPLAVVRGEELAERQWSGLPGIVGLASRLVRSDARYTQVIRNLLGRTVVIDTIDHAIAAARQSGHRLRLVTLDGQVLSPGGAMTGGSLARSTGTLSRANELERLKRAREALSAEMGETEQEREKAVQESEELLARLEKAGTELESARQAHTDCVLAAQRARTEWEALAQDEDTARTELLRRMKEASDEWEASKSARGSAQLSLEKNAADEENASRALAEAQRLDEEAGERRTEALRELEERRGALRESTASADAIRAHLDGVREDARRRAEGTRDYEAENRTLAEQEREAQDRRGALVLARDAARESLDGITQEKLDTEKERVTGERRRADLQNRQLSLERERVRQENRVENAKKAQDSLTASLWDEYGLTRATAQECAVPQDDPKEARARAEELRREIRGMGSVYTGAIEEYDKLRERVEFYTVQRTDAQTSRTKLTGVISELNREMRRRFTEQFDIISRAFNETFREVFGGGQAKLELEDTADVLNCGIEIRVQIPGKTLKTLSLLSGGERAFVAIALYFAILRVRPTPFCILDEIDAALDDCNVLRFAKYLRSYTEHTQFIVITHRRHTMEEADMLYGVAMPAQGISKLLAFDVRAEARELGIEN